MGSRGSSAHPSAAIGRQAREDRPIYLDETIRLSDSANRQSRLSQI